MNHPRLVLLLALLNVVIYGLAAWVLVTGEAEIAETEAVREAAGFYFTPTP